MTAGVAGKSTFRWQFLQNLLIWNCPADRSNPGGVCNNGCATRDSMAVFPKLFREMTE
jgi:hypothetical protein